MLDRATNSLARLQAYRRRFGWRATVSRLARELGHRAGWPRETQAPDAGGSGVYWPPVAPPAGPPPAAPSFYLAPRGQRPRVTLFGDDFDLRGPYRPTAAALALAAAVANRLDADLRLIARSRAIDPAAVDATLRSQGLALQGNCILLRAPQAAASEFDRHEGELMFAASWQGAADALAELPARDLVCLLHADDRLERLTAAERSRFEALLRHEDLRFVACTQRLQQHLADIGFEPLARRAAVFEPAPAAVPAGIRPPEGPRRRQFVFHVAEPADRLRIARGIEAIEQALASGLIDGRRWDVLFIGHDIPPVTLNHGLRPRRLDDLAALQQADVALALPHGARPCSAIPALAAAGAVVVVAAAAAAAGDGMQGSPRVIACGLERDALAQALRQAVALATDDAGRPGPRPAPADWTLALAEVSAQLAPR